MFPDPEEAADAQGLVAWGGDLQPATLLEAYSHGIFPWFNDDQPILWWSPDPRHIIEPGQIQVPRTVAKNFRRHPYRCTFNQAFSEVIHCCATLRPAGTWITPDMEAAYIELHHLGWAHSVEVWLDDKLIGGLYGLALDRCFHGESMFSLRPDASKFALVTLAKRLHALDFRLIDCQLHTEHLARMGAHPVSRASYLEQIRQYGQLIARQL